MSSFIYLFWENNIEGQHLCCVCRSVLKVLRIATVIFLMFVRLSVCMEQLDWICLTIDIMDG